MILNSLRVKAERQNLVGAVVERGLGHDPVLDGARKPVSDGGGPEHRLTTCVKKSPGHRSAHRPRSSLTS